MVRADAVRNRQRIESAADTVLATQGVQTPMETIARTAGVGVGTLYRHFPDKDALVDALAVRRIEEITSQAAQLSDDPATTHRLATLLTAWMDRASTDAVLRAALTAGPRPALDEAIRHSRPAVDSLIAADIATGSLRADLTFDDFRTMCRAIVSTMGHQPTAGWRRALELMLTGIGAAAEPDLDAERRP